MASTEKQPITSHSLITDEHVKEALKCDKGSDAVLESWKVVDFTKPGDNYVCVVTSVEVKYLKDNQECQVTYVVKLNGFRNLEGFPDVTKVLFEKEGKFYQEILPALNEALISAGQEPLRLPKCFHVFLEDKKEQMYFEDLRARDFIMLDRRYGMDKDHVDLVIKEMARIHSASYVLMSKFEEGETAKTKYKILERDWLSFVPGNTDSHMPMFLKALGTAIMMLEKVGGYETAIEWMNSLKSEVKDVFGVQMRSKKFNSICHGDCWNNNILFRYNEEGHPIEVMLVDLQMCREASLATELNYFLFTSLTGDTRKPHFDYFMSVYHSSYKEVLEGGNLPMYFTQEELVQEFRDKNKYGFLSAIEVIPSLLIEPEDVPEMSGTDLDTFMEEVRRTTLETLDTNPLFKPRFLAVFNELMEAGLIS
ncbi:uncharacterized protein [Palaemon carinicauda]|uniref:uncharacterized protein n=1 Tax=Palaemon carinicauda TaxID=392227 RepID=UPI0035B69DA9